MARLLLLFAHPALEKSRVHARLIKKAQSIKGVTFHDLYETYPDFDIDIKKEQQLLLQHDIIIWQHPFYWYSSPAIIKQWLDLVLEHNWAYGSQGKMLTGKKAMNIISCGGSKDAYQQTGRNRFTVHHFLSVFDQTTVLCNMQYLPPFIVYGTNKLKEADMNIYISQYEQLLSSLVNDEYPVSQTIQS